MSSHLMHPITWIGNIPSHWEIKKLKFIFSEKKSTKNHVLRCGAISFGKVVFKDDEKVSDSTKESYQEVLEGDFLINPLNLNFDLKSLRIALSRINVIVSAGYIVLTINPKFDSEYYKYLLHKFDVEYMKFLGQGVRQTVSFAHIKNEYLVVPPIDEQGRIALYLDRKTSQIDELSTKIQEKIKLLEEKKNTLISEVVTKGLDPSVTMKDSGIEWLGVVPKHWGVVRLKYVADVSNSNVDKNIDPQELTVRLCNYVDVYKNNYITSDLNFMNATASGAEIQRFKLKKTDVLITKDSEDPSDIGVPALVKYEADDLICGYHLSIIRAFNIMGEYIFWYLKSNNVSFYFKISATGFTRYALSLGDIKNIYIPIPPLPEQQAIATYLDTQTEKIDKIIELYKKKLGYLAEYRESLISNVVAGR